MVCSQGFEFEAFPAEVRLKVYHALLVDEDEHELDPTECSPELHPQILACNKKIHDEAAAVLYGENCFTWMFAGNCSMRLWHNPESDKTCLPRRYSRLITKMHIVVSFKGDANDISWQAVREGYNQTLANMEDVCKKLSLNDLKQCFLAAGGRFAGKPYLGEKCLLPLLKVRATQLKINDHASPAFTARLKANVEGPKDAVFLAGRQRQMEEPESDFDACEEDEENEQYGKNDGDERVEEGE